MNNDSNNNPNETPNMEATVSQPVQPSVQQPVTEPQEQPQVVVNPQPQPVQPQTIPSQPVAPESPTPVVEDQPVNVEPTNPVNVTPVEEVAPTITGTDLGLNEGEYGIVADEPVSKPKKKFPLGILIIILVIVLALGGGVVWYMMASSPKNIVKNVISGTFKEVNNVIDDYDKVHSKFEYNNQGLLLKGKIKVDSNIFESEEYKDLKINPKDYYFGLKMGISPKDKSFLIGGTIEGAKNTLGLDGFYENKKLYLTSDYFEKPIVIDLKDQITTEEEASLDEMFNNFDESFDKIMETLEKSTVKPDDLKYLSSVLEKAFVDSLDEKKMTKSNGTIEVNGKTIKANKIIYELDKENLKRTIKLVCDKILNDEKALKIIANLNVSDTDTIKDSIKEFKASTDEIELTKPIYLNIYTTGLTNKFAGIDIEKEDKKVLSYYVDNKNAEIMIKNEEDTIVVNITEGKTETTIIGKLNGKEYVSLIINTTDKDAIDFNATITQEESKTKLIVYLKQEISKSSIKIDFKIGEEDNDNKSSIEGNLELVTTDEKLETDTSKAIAIEKMTETDFDKIMEKIEKATKDDEPLTKLYEALKEKIEESKKQNQKSNGSQITCTGKSGYFDQKYVITYDNDLNEFSDITLYINVDTKDLSPSEAAELNVNNYCSTLKSMDSEISACTASADGSILKGIVKYDNDFLASGLKDNNYTADLNGVNSFLTVSGYTCSLN